MSASAKRANVTGDLFIETSAIFSPCRTWRYVLTRIWDPSLPLINWCALNSSTADEEVNDPTITRETRFTHLWGFGGLIKTNMYGYCSPDPKSLSIVEDPIGPENDRYLTEVARDPRVRLHVVAWGAHPKAAARTHAVLKLLHGIPLVCLGRTKNGAPAHPLFIPKKTPYEPYP